LVHFQSAGLAQFSRVPKDRERFVEVLKDTDIPQKALELVVSTLGEMDDRIAQLKRRILMV
jgi:hypothetical protein